MVMPDTPPTRPEAELRVGFTAELACAPLVVAAELGLWSQRGLSVQLRRELGVAGLRNQLLEGNLHAAQVPCGLPLALLAEADRSPETPPPLWVGMTLSHGGQTLVLAESLWPSGTPDTAAAIHPLGSRQKRVVTLALASRHSAQAAVIREWMRTAQWTEEQVNQVVIPMAQLTTHLRAGNIDGFCAGPLAAAEALMDQPGPASRTGRVVTFSKPGRPPLPETVLALRSAWAHRSPCQSRLLMSGLREACRFCEDPSHRPQVAEWLSRRHYLHRPVGQILQVWNTVAQRGNTQGCPDTTSLAFQSTDTFQDNAAFGRWIFDHALEADDRRIIPVSALNTVFRMDLLGTESGSHALSLQRVTSRGRGSKTPDTAERTQSAPL
jgi:ABC-type nitrate/sulfonate/bicarbonate transport system substrate-binding protein